MIDRIPQGTQDVPTRIFEHFLAVLEAEGASTNVTLRLRKVLLEEKAYTDTALKAAIVSQDPPLV